MTALALVSTVLTFVAIVGIGALLRAAGVLRREDAHPLNRVIVYVGLPAYIFNAVHGAVLRFDLLGVVAVAWAVFAVMLGLGWAASRVLGLRGETAGGFIIAAALGNTGFIGYPVTAAFLGSRELPEAIFYDVFGTVCAFVLVATLVAEHYGRHEGVRINLLRELLSFPALVALVAALALHSVPIPSLVTNGIGLLANMVAPLIMISVGLSLRASVLGERAGALASLGALRLLVAPVIGLAAGWALLGAGPALRVATLEAGMPTMMLALVMGERFGLDTDFIASAIFVTTAASAIALPLVQLAAFH